MYVGLLLGDLNRSKQLESCHYNIPTVSYIIISRATPVSGHHILHSVTAFVSVLNKFYKRKAEKKPCCRRTEF